MNGGFHGYYDISSLYPSVNRIFMCKAPQSTEEELRQIEETLYIIISVIEGFEYEDLKYSIRPYAKRLFEAYRNFNIFSNSYMNLINKTEVEQITILLNENRELKKKLAEYEGGDNEDKIYDL